jgi:glycosyltransferase involved in cell wall biosynthesis
MKIKVLLVAETVMDGVGKHVDDIIDFLDKDKFELTVAHGTSRVDHRFKAIQKKWQNEIKFVEIPELAREIKWSTDYKAYRALRRLIRKVKPDVVHCHSSKAGVVGRLAAKVSGVKRIYYTPHAYAMQNPENQTSKYLLYLSIERFLARFATTNTINVSLGEKHFAVKHKIQKPDHFRVIYNALGPQRTNHPAKVSFEYIPEGVFVVGCIARLFEQKNPVEFLTIARDICQKRNDVYFIWVGTGELLDNAKSLSETYGISDRVFFVGHQVNIQAYLEKFDIFLSTALYEGLPYTLIESMQAKCPILATDVIGNNEAVKHGYNGYLYHLGDVSDACTKLEIMLDNATIIEKMEIASQVRFNELFTIDKMMLQIEKLYMNAL